MTPSAYALIGLTMIVAGLVGILIFAVLRFAAAARDARLTLRDHTTESAFLTSALEEAMAKLRVRERAQAERAEASERLNSEIVASLTAGLLVLDGAGEVRMLNPAGQRILGISDANPSGNFRGLLKRAQPLAEALGECLTNGRPIVRRVLQLSGGVGSESHLGVTVSPLFDGQGRPHGAVCLFTDLTAIVELEEQLRLKESLAQLGELTAGIAHEFRNGLSTIHGYGKLIELDELPQAYRPHVQGIRHETVALGQVVTNFLNFARPAPLALSPVNLATLAERAADELRAEIQRAGGQVVVTGEFATIEGDEVLLRQALSNLARNALEACTQAQCPPQIFIEGQVDGPQGLARVIVRDNGPGVDEAARARIFQPFFTTKPQGTGLGLALVQRIIVTHNGRIHVGAGSPGGAAFTVTLPLSPPRD